MLFPYNNKTSWSSLNTIRLRQNRRHFAGDIFKCISSLLTHICDTLSQWVSLKRNDYQSRSDAIWNKGGKKYKLMIALNHRYALPFFLSSCLKCVMTIDCISLDYYLLNMKTIYWRVQMLQNGTQNIVFFIVGGWRKCLQYGEYSLSWNHIDIFCCMSIRHSCYIS